MAGDEVVEAEVAEDEVAGDEVVEAEMVPPDLLQLHCCFLVLLPIMNHS